MSDYSLLILIQSLFILIWVFIVKFNALRTPEFDSWLTRILQQNPSVQLEDAFNEYIHQFDVMTLHEADESDSRVQARAKMQLIEQYDLDDVLGEHEEYKNFKVTLEKSLK